MISASAAAIHTLHASADTGLEEVQGLRTGVLNEAMTLLLTAFAFVLPVDLRLAGDKSIAMRIGYACLLLGLAGLIKRRTIVLPGAGFWWLLGFVGWSSFSLVWARYPDVAQHKILLYIAVFAVTAIIPQYAWDEKVRARLMDAYLAGCVLGIVGTAMNFALGNPYTSEGEVAAEGRYSYSTDPNYLALTLVIGIPLALHRAGSVSARWQKTIELLYVPAAVAAVFLTGSRGALIALLMVILVYALFSGVRAPALLLAGAGLCMVIGALLPAQISERFTSIPEELRYGTLSDRRELWDRGKTVVSEHPLEGIGVGATSGTMDIAAHNTPLELAMEGGVVSLSLFYGALLVGLYGAWRSNRKESRVLIALWAAWIAGSLSLSWEINSITWFLFALLFSTASARPVEACFHTSASQT
ncbi:MAG: O-antigen ligase family protein [Terracidiphilus sp.]|nr:O-antigen ligase family protein [Terracidiphilus sp.]